MSLGVLSLLLLASAQTPRGASPSPPPVRAPAARANAAPVTPSPVPSAAPSPAATPAPPPEVDASGTWTGSTSQGREVEIDVEGNEVKLLRLGWQIEFERECPAPDTRLPQREREGVHVMRYQYPESVRAGRLRTRLGLGSDLDLLVTGVFAADGTASGEMQLATVEGARCAGKVDATWKATRR